MFAVTLDAMVIWPDRTSMSGKVELNYSENQNPWLVHAVFRVQDATEWHEIERVAMHEAAVAIIPGPVWFGQEGSSVRIGRGTTFARFRITDQSTGAWTDWDVPIEELRSFLADTVDRCSEESERAALSAHVEKGLGELP
jgi:hypothetical protein